MKKLDNPTKKVLLYSVTPCVFSLLLLLFTWWRIPVLLVLAWTLCLLWVWFGYRSRELLGHYGRALITLHWLGFFCLIFACIYYSIVIPHHLWYADFYFSISDEIITQYFIPKYMVGDIIVSLFPSCFSVGVLYPYLGYGNRTLMVISINTLSALVLFSIGYLANAGKERLAQKNGKS